MPRPLFPATLVAVFSLIFLAAASAEITTGTSGSSGSSSTSSASLSLGSSVKVKQGRFKLKAVNGSSSAFSGVTVVTAKLGGQFGSGQTTIASYKVSLAAGESKTKSIPLTSAVKKLLKKKRKFSAIGCIGTNVTDLKCKNFKLKA